MKKFAQVQNCEGVDTVWYVFEQEDDPVFAPNIEIHEITGQNDIAIGWTFDRESGAFLPPEPPAPEPPNSEVYDTQAAIMMALCDLYMAIDALNERLDTLEVAK